LIAHRIQPAGNVSAIRYARNILDHIDDSVDFDVGNDFGINGCIRDIPRHNCISDNVGHVR
jgi:hypothetical protein